MKEPGYGKSMTFCHPAPFGARILKEAMHIMKYYVVDAFTDTLFHGNPAGVCLLEKSIGEQLMQQIARENNLPETAFVQPIAKGRYRLRWFSPELEVDLCGHGTLATTFILHHFVSPEMENFHFDTKSGELSVSCQASMFELNFPARPPEMIDNIPAYSKAIGCEVLEAWLSRDLLLLVRNEQAVRDLEPDLALMKELDDGFGVIVTALGHQGVDFVSRFFAPRAGIPEDPVTGSSHCTLAPFWSQRLNRRRLSAQQLSERGGSLRCRCVEDRVFIAGKATLYLSGEIRMPVNPVASE